MLSKETPAQPNNSSNGPSRREFLGALTGVLATTALGVTSVSAEAQENRFKNPRVFEMEDHNMPRGFKRSSIVASVDEWGKVIGSVFFLDENVARAKFVTKTEHPIFFTSEGRLDFERILSVTELEEDSKIALILAGAFYKANNSIDGVAIVEGRTVASNLNPNLNGILVIEKGVPRIEFLSEIEDVEAFLVRAKKEAWSLFQQTSFIRPGGRFQTSNPNQYELRFFVEGEGKKAIINFSEKMTYTEALAVLENLAGFKIEKAIGLDTGVVSEARFFDKYGSNYLMLDEQYGAGRNHTNAVVFFSQDPI